MLKITKKGRVILDDPPRVLVYHTSAFGTDMPLVVETPGTSVRLSKPVARDVSLAAVKHNLLSLDELELLQKEVYRAISRAQADERRALISPASNQGKSANGRCTRPGAGQGARVGRNGRKDRAAGSAPTKRRDHAAVVGVEWVPISGREQRSVEQEGSDSRTKAAERAELALARKPGHESHAKRYIGVATALIFESDKQRWRRYYYHAYVCDGNQCEEAHYFYFEQTPASAMLLYNAFERPDLSKPPLVSRPTPSLYSLDDLLGD